MEEGQLISVKNVSLSKATFVKFRAQNVDFLEISNHRAVLEVTLRKFTCLSEGDQICISHIISLNAFNLLNILSFTSNLEFLKDK